MSKWGLWIHNKRGLKFKWRLFFASYDMWVGLFVDKKNSKKYICLLPCVVLERYPYCYHYLIPSESHMPDGTWQKTKGRVCGKEVKFQGVDQHGHKVFLCDNDPQHEPFFQ